VRRLCLRCEQSLRGARRGPCPISRISSRLAHEFCLSEQNGLNVEPAPSKWESSLHPGAARFDRSRAE
jgi:hypothetical protein